MDSTFEKIQNTERALSVLRTFQRYFIANLTSQDLQAQPNKNGALLLLLLTAVCLSGTAVHFMLISFIMYFEILRSNLYLFFLIHQKQTGHPRSWD